MALFNNSHSHLNIINGSVGTSCGCSLDHFNHIKTFLDLAKHSVLSVISTIGFAITEALLYYLIAINVVTFLVYGIDKRKAEGR